jgi:stringent starvation protein B
MSTRPYLIRAMWQWAHDNAFTPQLLVDATVAEVVVPLASVESGRIVLNVHDRAVVDLEMGNDLITFSARFGGVPQAVVVPVDAVLAIFAKENSQGIFFHDETGVKSTGEDDQSPTPAKRGGGPHLRLVE